MPQLSLYLDETTHQSVVTAANRENKSLSAWAREHLLEAATPKGWPPGYFEFLESVDVDIERPEQPQFSDDSPRESL